MNRPSQPELSVVIPVYNEEEGLQNVRITSQAVKEADPTTKVLIGGLEIPFDDYRERIYEREQLPILQGLRGKGIDILDLHWFGHLDESGKLPKAIERVRNDLKQCGFENTAIWFTEMGTYSGNPRHHQGHPLPLQSERQQATEMLKRHLVALGEGIEKLFWAWGMVEGFVNVHDNDYFDNTGFVYDGIGPDDPGSLAQRTLDAFGDRPRIVSEPSEEIH